MEQRVNDFLRDQVAIFETGMEKLEAKNAAYNDMEADACAYGYDLRDAIEEAVENGILIKAETMNAIKRVEHNYVTPYGGESLTRQYDKLCELNDARKHHRDESAIQAAQDVDRFAVITGGSVHDKKPVRLVDVLSGRMSSMSRGTDGQPLTSSTPSQGSRQGSIVAAFLGSSITVGRRTPRVASHTGTSAAERYGLVADEVQQREDDGFEL